VWCVGWPGCLKKELLEKQRTALKGENIMVTIEGTIKYARHMQGQSAGGKAYSFFSFVVLDNDEGVRWPIQVQDDHPQFAELCQSEKQLMDQPVRVVLRSFSAGLRAEKVDGKETGKKVPQARFFAKSVQVLKASASRAA
jgi:hypothetical protein